MTDLNSLVTQLSPALKGVGFLGVVGGVAKGFEWLEQGINKEGTTHLTKWLKNVPGDEQIDTWAAVFPDLIDRIFGYKPFSIGFFLRSCVASLIAVATVTIVAITIYGYQDLFSDLAFTPFETITALAIAANLLPDYISLLISRWIVKVMAKNPRPTKVGLLLILDTGVTVLLATIALILGSCISSPALLRLAHPAVGFTHGTYLDDVLVNLKEFFPLSNLIEMYKFPPFDLMVMASLFTSLWVWLYVLASGAIRLLHKARFFWVKIVPYLDIEKKPLQAIGRVAGLLAGAGYACVGCGYGSIFIDFGAHMTDRMFTLLVAGLTAFPTIAFTAFVAYWSWKRDQERLVVLKVPWYWRTAAGTEVLAKGTAGGILVRNLSLFPVRVTALGFAVKGKVVQVGRYTNDPTWPLELASHAGMQVNLELDDWQQVLNLGIDPDVSNSIYTAEAITETGHRFTSNRMSVRFMRPFRWVRRKVSSRKEK